MEIDNEIVVLRNPTYFQKVQKLLPDINLFLRDHQATARMYPDTIQVSLAFKKTEIGLIRVGKLHGGGILDSQFTFDKRRREHILEDICLSVCLTEKALRFYGASYMEVAEYLLPQIHFLEEMGFSQVGMGFYKNLLTSRTIFPDELLRR